MEGFLWHWASLEGWVMWGENRTSKSTEVCLGVVREAGRGTPSRAWNARQKGTEFVLRTGVGGSRNGFEQRRKSLVSLDHF